MKRQLFKVIVLLIVLNSFGPANADTIYESATMGPTGINYGYLIDNTSFMGSRFYTSQNIQVTAIGGHLASFAGGSIFGAIVKLDSFTDFPNGRPLYNYEVAAYKVFTLDYASSDYRTPLSANLPPGYYALVFGSGLYGATGSAILPWTDQTDLGTPSYMAWYSVKSTGWYNAGALQGRFVVEGRIVPEPATLLLFALGGLALRIKR
jgi:hypothetical protein